MDVVTVRHTYRSGRKGSELPTKLFVLRAHFILVRGPSLTQWRKQWRFPPAVAQDCNSFEEKERKKIDQLVLFLRKRRNEPNKGFHYIEFTVIFCGSTVYHYRYLFLLLFFFCSSSALKLSLCYLPTTMSWPNRKGEDPKKVPMSHVYVKGSWRHNKRELAKWRYDNQYNVKNRSIFPFFFRNIFFMFFSPISL